MKATRPSGKARICMNSWTVVLPLCTVRLTPSSVPPARGSQNSPVPFSPVALAQQPSSHARCDKSASPTRVDAGSGDDQAATQGAASVAAAIKAGNFTRATLDSVSTGHRKKSTAASGRQFTALPHQGVNIVMRSRRMYDSPPGNRTTRNVPAPALPSGPDNGRPDQDGSRQQGRLFDWTGPAMPRMRARRCGLPVQAQQAPAAYGAFFR
jgi:hypothetical protein